MALQMDSIAFLLPYWRVSRRGEKELLVRREKNREEGMVMR